MSVCSKFCRLRFFKILFELVYSWESCYKNKKGAHFIETQCSLNCYRSQQLTLFVQTDTQTDRHTYNNTDISTYICRQTDKQTDRQTDRQTEG